MQTALIEFHEKGFWRPSNTQVSSVGFGMRVQMRKAILMDMES